MAAATSVVVLDRGNNTTCTINLHGKYNSKFLYNFVHSEFLIVIELFFLCYMKLDYELISFTYFCCCVCHR